MISSQTGRHYCGRKVLSCRCCNGFCGPNVGCNCDVCKQLDKQKGLLPSQFISAKTRKYYCGRKVLTCRCCNGFCGPTNGCNCAYCQRLDKEPKRGLTGKFYCGKKVLLCRCCNGSCGPTNGCNCLSCQKLDREKGLTPRQGLTGKFYCGRKVLTCGCCNGFCGPNNGCNCADCQKLDAEVKAMQHRGDVHNPPGYPNPVSQATPTHNLTDEEMAHELQNQMDIEFGEMQRECGEHTGVQSENPQNNSAACAQQTGENTLAATDESQMCGICMERRRDMAFMCGHMICSVCGDKLRLCHMCRQPISNKIKLFD